MKKGVKRPDLYKARIGTCLVCNSEFRAVKDFKERKQKYCSKACWSIRGSYRTKKCIGCGKLELNKLSKKYCSRQCAQKYMKAEMHGKWKGHLAGYSAKHKTLGNPGICFNCNGNRPRVEWANISGKYHREKNDYIPLCSSCHRFFDTGKSFDRKSLITRWCRYTGSSEIKINGKPTDWVV